MQKLFSEVVAAVSRQLSAVGPKGRILTFRVDVAPATLAPQRIHAMYYEMETPLWYAQLSTRDLFQ